LGDFQRFQQSDAHEFLSALIDGFGTNTTEDAMRERQGYDDEAPPFCPPALEMTSFMQQIFGGVMQSRIKCGTCGTSSTTFDVFRELVMELSNSESIEQALEQFTRVERVEGWRCDKCDEPRNAVKQLTVYDPPRTLLTTLKRFDFLNNGIKITKRIAFREGLLLCCISPPRAR
jgi:ubiquitin carboxyl-terminal hydrolase 36/42